MKKINQYLMLLLFLGCLQKGHSQEHDNILPKGNQNFEAKNFVKFMLFYLENHRQWIQSVYGEGIDFIDIIDTFINSSDEIFILNDNTNKSLIAHEIKWNDTLHRHYRILMNNDSSSFTGGRQSIGMNTINRYLKYFNFIIRGHEDKYANAWLLNKDKHKSRYIMGSDYMKKPHKRFKLHIGTTNDILYDSNANAFKLYNVNDINMINGPVQSISTDFQNMNEESLNVLTIATNTDYDRPLMCDSFVVLRFDDNMIVPPLKTRDQNNIDIIKWMIMNEKIRIYEMD
jgi:hypothetical protein